MADSCANGKVTDSQWAEIQRLPTPQRIRFSLVDKDDHDAENGHGGEGGDHRGRRVVDVTKLEALERHLLIQNLIKDVDKDNLLLLEKIRKRIDEVGVNLPTIEVRYQNLCISAECEIVNGKPLPTLWNSLKSKLLVIPMLFSRSQEASISIIKDVSGIIKPGR